MKKLLLVGINSVHTYNFIELISGYFDDILLITDSINPHYKGSARIFDFSIKNAPGILRSFREIKNLVVQYKPSIIHLHQANTAAWCILTTLRSLQIPKVLTAWGSDILVNPGRGFLYRKMAVQILQRAEYFTTDALVLAERMKVLSQKNIQVNVIPFGIDPICKNLPELNAILAQKENIIYSNRLHKKLYRIEHIIQAFSSFIKNNPTQWQLIIAGEGEETEHLERLVSNSDQDSHVTFTGWLDREENFSWYRKAKIFVSYPESDATSVSLLEAMSAGCIPVVTDLPASHEWIQHKVNGIITSALNPLDYENAAALSTTQATANNLELILQKATKSHSRKLFLDLYDRILPAS